MIQSGSPVKAFFRSKRANGKMALVHQIFISQQINLEKKSFHHLIAWSQNQIYGVPRQVLEQGQTLFSFREKESEYFYGFIKGCKASEKALGF